MTTRAPAMAGGGLHALGGAGLRPGPAGGARGRVEPPGARRCRRRLRLPGGARGGAPDRAEGERNPTERPGIRRPPTQTRVSGHSERRAAPAPPGRNGARSGGRPPGARRCRRRRRFPGEARGGAPPGSKGCAIPRSAPRRSGARRAGRPLHPQEASPAPPSILRPHAPDGALSCGPLPLRPAKLRRRCPPFAPRPPDRLGAALASPRPGHGPGPAAPHARRAAPARFLRRSPHPSPPAHLPAHRLPGACAQPPPRPICPLGRHEKGGTACATRRWC